MEISRVTLIYFSPTGGTLRAARIVTGELRAPVEEIDITGPDTPRSREFGANELVVAAVPCYGGRVPEPAAQRLTYFSGRGTPALVLASFGNRAYDDVLRELGDILTGNGFVPAAAIAAVTEHSLARQFGAGRPDEKDQAELRAFAIRTRVKLGALADAEAGRVVLGGEEPYRKFGGLPMKPSVSAECGGCGKCARLCPAGAIDRENPTVTDGAKCIVCMRCVASCPRGARSLSKPAQMALALKLKAACGGRKKNELVL